MGRMAEITLGAGDAATAPWWAKHPELDIEPVPVLFTFETTTGTGDEPVTCVAEMYEDAVCSEIKSVTLGGVNIGSAISWAQHKELMKEAERQYERQQEEDAA